MAGLTQEDINLINQGLVDSRVKRLAGEKYKTIAAGRWIPVYCVLCGKESGAIAAESFEFVRVNSCIRVCDNCATTLGPPPGTVEVPKEFIHELEPSKRMG